MQVDSILTWIPDWNWHLSRLLAQHRSGQTFPYLRCFRDMVGDLKAAEGLCSTQHHVIELILKLG